MLTRAGLKLLLAILLLNSCTGSPESKTELESTATMPVDSAAIKAAIAHEQDSIYTAFFVKEYLNSLLEEGAGKIRGRSLFSDVMMPELYESYAYQLLWKDSTHRQNALLAIAGATADGLEPDEYHLQAIQDLIASPNPDYDIQAGIDILITDGIIHYGTHLLNGKTDPQTLVPTLSHTQRVLSDEVLEGMRQQLLDGEVQAIFSSLRPPSTTYNAMMDGLAKYRAIADSSGWRPISISSRKLEPGASYSDIPSIRERMLIEGDLLAEDMIDLSDSTADVNQYDVSLQRAVERFQLRHGLNPDGVIGRGTVKAMNISVDEKIRLLKANMERARWIHHDLDSNYVLVNIAGFDLHLVKGDTLCWTTKVMAGKVTTATPIFRDEMTHLELNPYWTVPFSISNGEILPKLKKDSTYLSRNGMELLTMSGSAVNERNLDFSRYEEKLPYIVRQKPGGGNSLGRVKFLFPNRFRVYLHDTPSRSLFAREKRAFSHGCIRVQDPLKMTELLLAEQDIDRAYIDSVIVDGNRLRVNLDEALPVLITYSTAYADEDLIYFYEDVYRKDKALFKALGL